MEKKETNNQTGPISPVRYYFTYINLHVEYRSNPIRILRYREKDEVYADAATVTTTTLYPSCVLVLGIQLVNLIYTRDSAY